MYTVMYGRDIRNNTLYLIKEQAGFLWTWWKGDELPSFPARTSFSVRETTDRLLINKLMLVGPDECTQRLNDGHRAYIAYIHGIPAAYGWTAINHAAFGSPSVFFRIPPGNCYLYHFVTQISYRGQSIYPRLLQAIIERESVNHDRFWIIHQQSNAASQRGIAKAGFRIACQIHHLDQRRLGLTAGQDEERARAGADLLGLPLLTRQIAHQRVWHTDTRLHNFTS